MEKDIYRSQFRMPQDLYERLKAEADKNKRSVNAELVARLEDSFNARAPSALRAKVGDFLTENFDDIMEKVVREAVQNSLDASRAPKKGKST